MVGGGLGLWFGCGHELSCGHGLSHDDEFDREFDHEIMNLIMSLRHLSVRHSWRI